MKTLKTAGIALIVTLLVVIIAHQTPYSGIGTTVTQILGTDKLSDLDTLINTISSELNVGKMEVSTTTLPLLTTLAGLTSASSLVTIGTIGTGVWEGTTVDELFGGTGFATYSTGDIIYASASNVLSRLTASSTNEVLTLVGGVPVWRDTTVNEAANFTWTGAHIFNSTVDIEADAGANLTLNTVAYEFPSSDGVAGQVWQTDGSGVLSFANNSAGAFTFSTTTDIVTTSSATTSPLVIPAGALTASSTIEVWGSTTCNDTSGGATCTFELRDGNGVKMASCNHDTENGTITTWNFHAIITNTNSSTNQSVCYSNGVQPGTTPFAQILNIENTSSVDITAELILMGNITQLNGNNYTLKNMIIRVTP